MSLFESCGRLPFGWGKVPAGDDALRTLCGAGTEWRDNACVRLPGNTYCGTNTTYPVSGTCVANRAKPAEEVSAWSESEDK